MKEAVHPRPISLVKSALLVLLLALLLVFNRGQDLFYGLVSLSLLASYHLLTDSRFSSEQIRHTGLMALHIGVYLLLCTLMIWVTTEEEESVNWIIYLLPIAVAAASLSLKHTLTTCAVATALFFSQVPPELFLDPAERSEELPELLVFAITFFLVGVLIQSYSEQSRRQLARQQELNERLLENQANLKESLGRLEAAEEGLRRRDRLAALGEMSAGIAHEIRNPLGVISSSAQLLGRKIAEPVSDVRQLLDIIQEEATRLNGLISDFLTFGRPAPPALRRIDLKAVALKAVEHIGGMAREKSIRVVTEFPEIPPSAQADPDMLQQVLLNLLLNALDASPAGAEVTVRLCGNDGTIYLEIHDGGCGIPPDNLSKIFNPFFTTKEKGTGLGLANAHQIIETHGGSLTVNSSPEEGTTFRITLPLEV